MSIHIDLQGHQEPSTAGVEDVGVGQDHAEGVQS